MNDYALNTNDAITAIINSKKDLITLDNFEDIKYLEDLYNETKELITKQLLKDAVDLANETINNLLKDDKLSQESIDILNNGKNNINNKLTPSEVNEELAKVIEDLNNNLVKEAKDFVTNGKLLKTLMLLK